MGRSARGVAKYPCPGSPWNLLHYSPTSLACSTILLSIAEDSNLEDYDIDSEYRQNQGE